MTNFFHQVNYFQIARHNQDKVWHFGVGSSKETVDVGAIDMFFPNHHLKD